MSRELSRDDMVSKIVKVLNIDKNSTGEEKRTSWMMARKLMAKYRIEYEEVAHRVDDFESTENVVQVVVENTWYNIKNPQLRELADVVAKNFRCVLLVNSSSLRPRTALAVFVGLEDDAKLASTIFKLIYETCKYEANILLKKYLAMDEEVLKDSDDYIVSQVLGYGIIRKIDFKSTYYNGFTEGLSGGFLEQTSNDNSTGLMVIVPKSVVSYVDDLNLEAMEQSVSRIYGNLGGVNSSAYGKGFETSSLSSKLVE